MTGLRARRPLLVALLAASVVGGVLTSGGTSTAAVPQGSGGPVSTPAVHHDTSRPLRDMPQGSTNRVPDRVRENRHLPLSPGRGSDGALQVASGAPAAASTPAGFAGVGNGDYGFAPNAAPPDTNGAVGATQYVQWVNESFAVFDKTTHAIAPGFPKTGNTLWAGFGGGCETNNDGDPVAQYDKAAGVWVLTQFSVSTTPYLQCVAVSTTSDATGSYHRYAFSYGSTQFNDYPKLGVWPDGYYVTYNIFNNGTTFAGSKVCALDRAQMLTGGAATQQCIQLGTSYGGLLPSDLDGTIAPPTGAPNYLLNIGSNSLNLWRFHADFTTPANSTFTGPTNIPVAAFSPACGGGTCIRQAGTSQKLDSLADRLMYRLAYRHFADGHEALVVNHSVKVSGSRRTEVDGVRWYEIRSPGTAPTVYQQGTYAPDGSSRWMGSSAMDKVGNLAVGYSRSSGTEFPSIGYAARIPTDAIGTLQGEVPLKAGGGSQSGFNLSRWGDYSSLTVDPVDDCTFWFTSEYEKTTGAFNWSTWISSFKLVNCV